MRQESDEVPSESFSALSTTTIVRPSGGKTRAQSDKLIPVQGSWEKGDEAPGHARSCPAAARRKHLEQSESFHWLDRRRLVGKRQGRSRGSRPRLEGAGLQLRHRFHLG